MNKNYKEKLSELKKIVSPSHKNTLDLVIPFHIYYKDMMQEIKYMLEVKYTLSKNELDLLLALIGSGNNCNTLAPTELYDYLLFSSGGMTKLLKKLEMKDYIIRVENPDDKRSKLVQITYEGKELAKSAIDDVLEIETQYFSKLNDLERSTLSNIFEKLAKK